jgi:excisionase family DNA binding protein
VTAPVTTATVTITRAAEILGVTRRSIYSYIRAGRLTTVRRGVSQRVEVASIQAFAAARTAAPVASAGEDADV